MAVPYTFATATSSIPLSQLDSNFATGITLGNTTVYLGNTTTSIGNLTLTNATISSVATTFPNSFLANSSVTIGSTNISLGGTSTTLTGLTGVTSSAITDSGLTSGRVTYATTGGLLTDSSVFTFDGANLSLVEANGSGAKTFLMQGGGTAGDYGIINISNGGTTKGRLVADASSQNFRFDTGGNATGAFTFLGGSGFTEYMRITSAGNVGIGTSSPSFGLVVEKDNGSGYVAGFRSASGSAMLTIQNTGGISQIQGLNSALSATADIGLQVSGGNVGIGIASPGGRLDIAGVGRLRIDTSNDYVYQTIINASGAAYKRSIVDALQHEFYLSGSEKMRIDSSGKWMLGTTSALNSGGAIGSIAFAGGQGLFIATNGQGNGQVMGFNYNLTTNVGSINITSTTTTYSTTSDYRLKENIVDAPSGNINDIKVRSFDWIADGSHQTYGMVAQELVEVAPYAVHQPQNPEEMMAVDYSKLVPMMIKEIQDLKQRIATLENK